MKIILIVALTLAMAGWTINFIWYSQLIGEFADLHERHQKCDSTYMEYEKALAGKDHIIKEYQIQQQADRSLTRELMSEVDELSFKTKDYSVINRWMKKPKTSKP